MEYANREHLPFRRFGAPCTTALHAARSMAKNRHFLKLIYKDLLGSAVGLRGRSESGVGKPMAGEAGVEAPAENWAGALPLAGVSRLLRYRYLAANDSLSW